MAILSSLYYALLCFTATGSHNDARMCLSIAITAARLGATIANHVLVRSLIKDPQTGKVIGTEVTDQVTGEKWRTYAKSAINTPARSKSLVCSHNSPVETYQGVRLKWRVDDRLWVRFTLFSSELVRLPCSDDLFGLWVPYVAPNPDLVDDGVAKAGRRNCDGKVCLGVFW